VVDDRRDGWRPNADQVLAELNVVLDEQLPTRWSLEPATVEVEEWTGGSNLLHTYDLGYGLVLKVEDGEAVAVESQTSLWMRGSELLGRRVDDVIEALGPPSNEDISWSEVTGGRLITWTVDGWTVTIYFDDGASIDVSVYRAD
jgi:hypothetical protein